MYIAEFRQDLCKQNIPKIFEKILSNEGFNDSTVLSLYQHGMDLILGDRILLYIYIYYIIATCKKTLMDNAELLAKEGDEDCIIM